MPSDARTLYPLLAVGAFMVMFLAGIVLAHELGLTCTALLGVGLLAACSGTLLVSELERRDRDGATQGSPAHRTRGAERPPARGTPAPPTVASATALAGSP